MPKSSIIRTSLEVHICNGKIDSIAWWRLIKHCWMHIAQFWIRLIEVLVLCYAIIHNLPQYLRKVITQHLPCSLFNVELKEFYISYIWHKIFILILVQLSSPGTSWGPKIYFENSFFYPNRCIVPMKNFIFGALWSL